jgi:hypothetical protein
MKEFDNNTKSLEKYKDLIELTNRNLKLLEDLVEHIKYLKANNYDYGLYMHIYDAIWKDANILGVLNL